MAIDDCPEWMKKDECFNLRRFKSPYVLARDIEQKFRKIIWSANPKIRLLDTTMVGRNEDIAKFEDKFQSGRGMKLRALIILDVMVLEKRLLLSNACIKLAIHWNRYHIV